MCLPPSGVVNRTTPTVNLHGFSAPVFGALRLRNRPPRNRRNGVETHRFHHLAVDRHLPAPRHVSSGLNICIRPDEVDLPGGVSHSQSHGTLWCGSDPDPDDLDLLSLHDLVHVPRPSDCWDFHDYPFSLRVSAIAGRTPDQKNY